MSIISLPPWEARFLRLQKFKRGLAKFLFCDRPSLFLAKRKRLVLHGILAAVYVMDEPLLDFQHFLSSLMRVDDKLTFVSFSKELRMKLYK